MEQSMMKAVIFNGKPWFDGLAYGDFPIPQAAEDWVLVRNNVCGVCGSDLHFFSGVLEGKYPASNLPAIFGHENAGTVVQADPATGFVPGDRVAVEAIHSCVNFGGVCARCRGGQFNMCDEGMTHVGIPYVRMLPGGYGEYSIVHKEKLHKLPDSVSLEDAALLDILVVNIHAVMVGQPKLGDVCAVFGCGVVGLNLIQTLKANGIANVIAICKHAFQGEMARKCGASEVVLYDKNTLAGDVMKLTAGMGVDKVFECVGGNSSAIAEAVHFTTRKGNIIMMGLFPEPQPIDLSTVLMREINILSSSSYAMAGHRNEFAIAIDLLKNKQINHEHLITHRFAPEDYVEAITAAAGKDKSKAIKVLFVRD